MFEQNGKWIEELYDAHLGAPGVIFGKGPSLSLWDFPRVQGEVWMTCNEACRKIRDADYYIMLDHCVINNLGNTRWQPTTGLVVSRHSECRLVLLRKYWPGKFVTLGTGADRIKQNTVTAGMGIMALAAMGVKRILMVGVDGYDSPNTARYAPEVGEMPYKKAPEGPTPKERNGRWVRVNVQLARSIEATGVEVSWWHRNPTRDGRGVFLTCGQGCV